MKKWEKEIVQKQISDEQKVIWRLRDSYKIAMQDVKDKISVLQSREQTQSVIYQLKYQQELQKQLENIYSKMSQEWYKDIDSYLKGCYEDGFFGTMYELHQSGIPIVIPFNQEEMAQMAAQSDYEGIKLSEKLYTDSVEMARISRQEITRGISTNESWGAIARRVTKRGEAGLYEATRIVRTESHRITNEVKMKTIQKVHDEGADIVKQWDSIVDKRTRPHHVELDGQTREIDQPFKIPSTGATAMFPGGFGKPGEDIHCRCVMLQRARWALDKSEIDKSVGDLRGATDEQLQAWADKLGVSKDELIKASNGIIEADGTINHSIKAKNYNDFKTKYKKKADDLTEQYKSQLDVIEEEKKAFLKSVYFPDENFADAKIAEWEKMFGPDDEDVKKWKSLKAKQAELEAKINGASSKEAQKAAKKAAKIQGDIDALTEEKKKWMNSLGWDDESKFDSYMESIASILPGDEDVKQWKKFKKKEATLQNKLSGGTKKTEKNGISSDAFSDARKKAAKKFTSAREADKYHRKYLDSIWDGYSEREKYSVWEYTHNSNPMNRSLSGYHDSFDRYNFVGYGKTKWGYEDKWRTFETKEFSNKFGTDGHVNYHRAITDLTKTIDKSELVDDVFLVRGSSNGGFAGMMESIMPFDDAKKLLDYGSISDVKAALEGNVVKNHAFTSTGIATGTGFSGEVMYTIYAPKGTHGIYAEPQSFFGDTVEMTERIYSVGEKYSGVGSEAEIIIQRGTSFRVTKISKSGRTYNVEMEIVDQPNYFKYGDEETFNDGATRHKD